MQNLFYDFLQDFTMENAFRNYSLFMEFLSCYFLLFYLNQAGEMSQRPVEKKWSFKLYFL